MSIVSCDFFLSTIGDKQVRQNLFQNLSKVLCVTFVLLQNPMCHLKNLSFCSSPMVLQEQQRILRNTIEG